MQRAPHRVRIIGGQWKRTPLRVVDAPGLRPTPDRVRETLFNWIAHLCPDLSVLRGLDLFAGSGALGYELASRGAGSVTLVETDAAALEALRAVRESLGAQQVEIIAGDALAVAARLPAAAFDIVFLDPPYDSDLLTPALAATTRLLAPGGLVYAEAQKSLDAAMLQKLQLEPVRVDRAGGVVFQLLRPARA